jgi:hypothetical protein
MVTYQIIRFSLPMKFSSVFYSKIMRNHKLFFKNVIPSGLMDFTEEFRNLFEYCPSISEVWSVKLLPRSWTRFYENCLRSTLQKKVVCAHFPLSMPFCAKITLKNKQENAGEKKPRESKSRHNSRIEHFRYRKCTRCNIMTKIHTRKTLSSQYKKWK